MNTQRYGSTYEDSEVDASKLEINYTQVLSVLPGYLYSTAANVQSLPKDDYEAKRAI
jgi:hypothetical protein